MIVAVTIDRRSSNYGEILDTLEYLSDELGSATNAAVQCIKDSPRYQAAKARLQENIKPRDVISNGELIG